MEVLFRGSPGRIDEEIFVYEIIDRERVRYLNFHAGQLTWTEAFIGPGEAWAAKPLFTMERSVAKELISAFIKSAKQTGIPMPTEDRMLGELEATKKHLEDLRNLVFKPYNKHVDSIKKAQKE